LRKELKTVGIVLLISLISACTNQHKFADNIEEYRSRVASVLNYSTAQSAEVSPLAYPSIRSLKKSIPEISINLRDFYALNDCEIMTQIAQRNTSLGRTQLPSTRYTYEVSLLQGLSECAAQIEDPKIKKQLTLWFDAKTLNLPLIWADLIQTSEEIALSMSSNDGFIVGDQNDNFNQVYQALRYLIDLENNPNSDIEILEYHLKTLKQNPLLARIWRSQEMLIIHLSLLSEEIKQHTEELNCNNSKQQTTAVYLNNVFKLFFIEQIQPAASALNSYQYKLFPLLERLNKSEVIDAALKNLLKEQKHRFDRYQIVIREHVQIWQKLLKQCGMSPQMQ
jgi:hypothetical protein